MPEMPNTPTTQTSTSTDSSPILDETTKLRNSSAFLTILGILQ